MAKFNHGDDVVYEGKVVCTQIAPGGDFVVVERNNRNCCMHEDDLTLSRAPVMVVMVRCVTCGFEFPLMEIMTVHGRAVALGMSDWADTATQGSISLEHFVRICAELAEKGITPQQFVEGL